MRIGDIVALVVREQVFLSHDTTNAKKGDNEEEDGQ